MAYLGKQPVLVSTEFRDEFNITSTANTVVTSGFVNSGSSNYLEVYRNGVLLGSSDYTLSTDNKTINLVDSAASGDIIVVTGRREINQGLKVTERRHEHVIQSGETTVTFPFPLTVDGTDVHINGIKLWYGNGSGDGTNSDFAINVNTKVVSFGVNPSVGDVVCIVSREPSATTSTPLPITDSNGASVLSESNGKVTLNNTNLGGSVVPNSSFMFRNKIINGGMQIAQRGTSFGTVNLVGSTFPYNLDRFCTGRANVVHNGHCTISQITGGGQKHQITQASGSALDGSEYFTIRQHIEGFNCFDLAGKQATLSFKVKTNKAGNYGVSFYDGTGSATITPQSITVSTADASAENKVSYTKTFTMPSSITADNASRLQLDICLAAHNRAGQYYPTGETQVDLFDSTSNYFEIYEIQLEEGTVATPFEHRPIGMELSLAQRYFFKGNSSVGPEYLTHGGNVPFTSRTSFPVTMNHSPDMTNLGFTNVSNSHSPSFVDISADGFGFRTNMTAGLGVGTVRSTIVYSADAEL